MRATRLFRTVNRINSIALLALLVVGALLALGALVEGLLRDLRRHRAAPPETVAAPAEPGGERLELQGPVELEGTGVTVAALGGERESDYGGSFGKGSSTVTRNLLFHDAASGRMHWLRPDDRAAIGEWVGLTEAGEPHGPVRWVRYELAEADTDGDGVIDGADRSQIAVSAPDGSQLVTVLRDVDEVRGWTPVKGGRTFAFFRRGREERVAELDLATRRLLRETPIPPSH